MVWCVCWVTRGTFPRRFSVSKDLVDISARELASEAEISVDDAVGVLEIARHEKKTTTVGDTALDLLQEVTKSKPIATRLLGLDGLLGGGLQLGEVTEICGGPGSGKTQFGIHACLAAQYAVDEAGKKSSAVFIDSEGSFIIERVASMAKHFLEDFRHLGADKLTRDDLLRGITYYRVHDFLEQVEILHSLPSYLQATPECKLLVIDTVAFHFRHGFEDYTQRARALDELALFLHGLATDFDLAVLLINHITTKSSSNNRQVSQERPALGESWTHSIANRVVFEWEANCRVARIIKSATLAHDSALFEVSERGVRDAIDEEY
ncbi:Rad51 [Phytophthora infestans]|uniref:DNA repair protein RAD51 homolog 3 n=1 Tax=Phytophthora infestans TaxID=4787 RepID=A0A833SJP7_PHYIN|nr:Rad51 [Phytophthora infestans]